ncbi:hypothetical protein [Yersinia massiliensis]|uniref:hypothetical protein n=1 Tax=Yersinia massiliensis TaxID=419257 RepID=UPI001CFEB452|nr:hypothetical protein [Yersinia massiliensis]MCB5306501.1 hypothetical protein [Yersinia massiliensis]
MKQILILCISTVLLLNATLSLAAQTANKNEKEKAGVTCKRPPEPPKDKNGHPLPPPKDHKDGHLAKGQPPHDGKHDCPPPSEKKIKKVIQ